MKPERLFSLSTRSLMILRVQCTRNKWEWSSAESTNLKKKIRMFGWYSLSGTSEHFWRVPDLRVMRYFFAHTHILFLLTVEFVNLSKSIKHRCHSTMTCVHDEYLGTESIRWSANIAKDIAWLTCWRREPLCRDHKMKFTVKEYLERVSLSGYRPKLDQARAGNHWQLFWHFRRRFSRDRMWSECLWFSLCSHARHFNRFPDHRSAFVAWRGSPRRNFMVSAFCWALILGKVATLGINFLHHKCLLLLAIFRYNLKLRRILDIARKS